MKTLPSLIFVTLLFSCAPSPSQSGGSESPNRIESVEGLDDTSSVVGHYFNPLKGVQLMTDTGVD